MVRVLIVDDSAVIREMLGEVLSDDPGINVVGSAVDPLIAREMIKVLNPDVITLDIEMPRMDGLDFLERIMRLRPMPVVMISSHVQPGATLTIRALEMGAVDVVGKPTSGDKRTLFDLGPEIITKVKAAARVRFDMPSHGTVRVPAKPRLTGAVRGNRVIAVGASTGGVQALNKLLPSMPAGSPPILVAQHMPAGFTKSFAERLDRGSEVRIAEAVDGSELLSGHAYIAPGGYHLEVARSAGKLICRVTAGTEADKYVPSVNVLFESMAKVVGAAGIGVLLTGMGSDGANGLLSMRREGAATACQDEQTSLIYGMPKVAASIGAAEVQLHIDEVAAYLTDQSCRPVRVMADRIAAAR